MNSLNCECSSNFIKNWLIVYKIICLFPFKEHALSELNRIKSDIKDLNNFEYVSEKFPTVKNTFHGLCSKKDGKLDNFECENPAQSNCPVCGATPKVHKRLEIPM